MTTDTNVLVGEHWRDTLEGRQIRGFIEELLEEELTAMSRRRRPSACLKGVR